eukprot:221861-Prymnesium_polylepis.2
MITPMMRARWCTQISQFIVGMKHSSHTIITRKKVLETCHTRRLVPWMPEQGLPRSSWPRMSPSNE